MNFRWVVCGVLLGCLGIASDALASDEETSTVSKGATRYEQYCSSCHGLDGRGRSPLAGLFRKAPADLTRIAERRGGWFPEVMVREIIDGRFIGHGAREMPVWGYRLSQQEMIAITEYLYTFQVPPSK